MGYFRSQFEAMQESRGGPTHVPGQSRSSPIAAYEGGSLAYACLIRWAKVGDADSDWVFDGSVPFRAWPRRLHELPSGATINRFELQVRAAELVALGISNPWVIASVHPWAADWYADSPARRSPDSRREQLEAAEKSGDVANYQRNVGWDLFSTDKAWRTAVMEERRIAPDVTTGRLNPSLRRDTRDAGPPGRTPTIVWRSARTRRRSRSSASGSRSSLRDTCTVT